MNLVKVGQIYQLMILWYLLHWQLANYLEYKRGSNFDNDFFCYFEFDEGGRIQIPL